MDRHEIALRLAPGTGLLVRRATALLYTVTPDADLVVAFDAAPPGGELQALASATVAAGFAVGAYVGLTWPADVPRAAEGAARVMAFGDIAVETDQPSLPMLSGAGSRTWVEHTLTITDGAVVEVHGADTAATTDLLAGTVLAGGFRLELRRAPAPVAPTGAPAATPAAGRDDTTSVPRPEPTPIEQPAPASASAPWEPTGPAHVAPAAAPAEPDHGDPDVTLPPPASEALLADVRSDPSRGSLVEAKVCADGHANPPTAARCAMCGEPLAAGPPSLVHVARPSLGQLWLDDGELIDLHQELLVGRNPDRDDDPARATLRRVKMVGEKVSRSHLEVRFQGWDVLVADCGSTNGTFVVPHPGGQVAALEPSRPQLIDPGAVVYFGSRSFTFLGRHGT